MRTPSDRELVHDRLGARFEAALSEYDTRRRVEVLTSEFLSCDLRGKRVLEVGTGLGYFASILHKRGAHVVATDIGANLLEHVRTTVGCETRMVDALSLVETFGTGAFDHVLSSECIEHTPDPSECLRQMARVLKPGGLLSVSTPNVLWYPAVKLATMLRIRPFDGLENFSTFGGIRAVLESEGVEVLREKGLHLFPFQLPLHGLSRWCDDHLQIAKTLMVNLCVLGRKRTA